MRDKRRRLMRGEEGSSLGFTYMGSPSLSSAKLDRIGCAPSYCDGIEANSRYKEDM